MQKSTPLLHSKDYHKYLENNYFTTTIINDIAKYIVEKHEESAYTKALKLYESLNKNELQGSNESHLQKVFITPLLEILGYKLYIEYPLTIQQKHYQLDYLLFNNQEHYNSFYKLSKEKQLKELENLICVEAKDYSKKLDTNKIDFTNNPHYQILNYLNTMRANYGFLTNGKYWRLYDSKKKTAQKTYLQIDIYEILKNQDSTAFYLFYRLFNSSFYYSQPKNPKASDLITKPLTIEAQYDKNEKAINQIELKIQDIIYGSPKEAYRDSILENIGSSLHKYYSNKGQCVKNEDLFHNSIIFIFRLIFLFYYESKFQTTLIKHRAYKKYSIYNFYEEEILKDSSPATDCNLYGNLIDYFHNLETGNDNQEIPMLNGGLFSSTKAILLNDKQAINNKTLKEIFKNMLIYKEHSKYNDIQLTLLRSTQNDFSLIDIKKLGEIYENLLSYEFRIARENTYIVAYKNYNNGKPATGEIVSYADATDLMALKKKIPKINEQREIKAGELYLVPHSNNRKATASYYTPVSLTNFMVEDSLKQQLKQDKAPHKLKIIDNACGSGHFLVDSLQILTQKVMEDITGATEHSYKNDIIKLIDEEKEKITHNLQDLGIKEEKEINNFIDEEQILKRILLKKCIYGVDYNNLAVEITKLALWIETFIFGTPLSFIEHHIKQGNSLMGSTIEELKTVEAQIKQSDFFFDETNFNKLHNAYKEIINITDTTKAESEKSKNIYIHDILPKQQEYNTLLNLLTYYKFIKAQGKNITNLENLGLTYFIDEKVVRGLPKKVFTVNKIEQVFNAYNKDKTNFMKELQLFQELFIPFNYGIEFPDAFPITTGEGEPEVKKQGFDVVIGNPPWEETAFSDKDFFPQFHSNYRVLTIDEKAEVREKYLKDKNYQWIADLYEHKKAHIQAYNNYLKANYPLNAGSGDNNFYQFFLEKNLTLLKDDSTGVLTYLTPSIWIYGKGTIAIRKAILTSYTLHYFYQFQNRMPIFPNVSNLYKIAIYQIQNQPLDSKKQLPDEKNIIQCRFMQHDPSILYTDDNIMKLSIANIKKLSPDSLEIPEVNNTEELKFMVRAYKFPTLSKSNIQFARELDLTIHKGLMKETGGNKMLTMFEGKSIHQFTHQFAKNNYFVAEKDIQAIEESKEVSRIKKQLPDDIIKHLSNDKINSSIDYNYKYYRLAFRDVAGGTLQRTLVSSILPKNTTYGNTLSASIPKNYGYNEDNNIESVPSYSLVQIFFLNSLFNSFILDFIIRKYVDTHVSLYKIKQLPVPQPTQEEILKNPEYTTLMSNAVLLSYMNSPEDFTDAITEINTEIDKFNNNTLVDTNSTTNNTSLGNTTNHTKQKINPIQPIDVNIIPTYINNKEKFSLEKRLENDCLVAKLYKTTHKELELIMGTFPVFHKKNPTYKELLLNQYKKFT